MSNRRTVPFNAVQSEMHCKIQRNDRQWKNLLNNILLDMASKTAIPTRSGKAQIDIKTNTYHCFSIFQNSVRYVYPYETVGYVEFTYGTFRFTVVEINKILMYRLLWAIVFRIHRKGWRVWTYIMYYFEKAKCSAALRGKTTLLFIAEYDTQYVIPMRHWRVCVTFTCSACRRLTRDVTSISCGSFY